MSTDQVWFVYILQCADRTLYTGITPSLKKRIALHQSGKAAKYTRGRGPVVLVYQEEHPNKSLALKREAQIKKLTRAQKNALIAS